MERLNVLILEDNLFDYNLLRSHLDAIMEMEFKCDSAYKLEDAIKFMDSFKYDIVLADLNVPDSYGIDTVRALVGHHLDAPLVVLTSMSDMEISVKAIHHGAQDYIVKEDLSPRHLYTSIQFALERYKNISQIREMSFKDTITGLFNRNAMRELICKQVHLSTRLKKEVGFIYFDILKFRFVNERYGSKIGDRILADTANILRATFRESDILIRYGGDEFLAIVMCDGEEDIKSIFERMKSAVDTYNGKIKEREWSLILNYGYILEAGKSCGEIDILIKSARLNMEKQKANMESL